MKMSLGYLRETVEALAAKGFAATVTETTRERDGAVVFVAHRHELTRGARERLILSCLRYPDGRETYWLEIADYHGLHADEFELDSWKHRPDRIEFKYYSREDGVGLAFVLALA